MAVYVDEARTTLADIRVFDPLTPTVVGAAISGSQVVLDRQGTVPRFWFPDGVDVLWGEISRGGPVVQLNADYDTRLDVAEGALLAPVGRRPRWVQPSQVLTTMQSGHGYTNNAGSTFTANDTADFVAGIQAAKIVTGGTGAQANVRKLGGTAFDATGKALRIRVKVDSVDHLSEIAVFVGTGSLAANWKWSIQVTGGSKVIQSGEWCILTLNWDGATVTGSPDRAALTDVQLSAWDDNTANPVTVHWQSVELIPDGSATWPNGVISICFDDAYASQWTMGMPKLSSLGYPASAYVINDYVDTAGRLTWAQLLALQDRHGWEIGSHAATGVNHSSSWTGLTAAALEQDIRAQRAALIRQGVRGCDGTAYPLGQFGQTSDGTPTVDLARRYFSYARSTHSRTVETFPPADPFRLRAMSGISTAGGGVAPSVLTTSTTGALDRCKANKSWLIVVFHDIVVSGVAATSQILQSDFNTIVDAINTKAIPVVPVGHVLGYFG